jgi:hypothetical protein
MEFPAGTASGSLISTTTQSDIKNVFASGGSADNSGVFTVGDKVLATRFSSVFLHYISFLCLGLNLFILSRTE